MSETEWSHRGVELGFLTGVGYEIVSPKGNVYQPYEVAHVLNMMQLELDELRATHHISQAPSEGGRWFAYVAEQGWNRTGLGVAFYDNEGMLAGSKFAPIDEAVRRGDYPDDFAAKGFYGPVAPPSLADMERRLETIGNAMSITKWTGGLWTMVWDEAHVESTFRYVTGDEVAAPSQETE